MKANSENVQATQRWAVCIILGTLATCLAIGLLIQSRTTSCSVAPVESAASLAQEGVLAAAADPPGELIQADPTPMAPGSDAERQGSSIAVVEPVAADAATDPEGRKPVLCELELKDLVRRFSEAVTAHDVDSLTNAAAELLSHASEALPHIVGLLQQPANEAVRIAAAEALAVIGTSEAAQPLIELVSKLPPSPSRERMVAALSRVSNQESSAILLEATLGTSDSGLFEAGALALSGSAGAGFVRSLIDVASTEVAPDRQERALVLLANLHSEAAVEPLEEAVVCTELSSNSPWSPVNKAAAAGLASIGTAHAASTLLRSLDAQGGSVEDKVYVGTLVSELGEAQPAALSALLYAAEGNKDATEPHTRVAALTALANYANDEARQMLIQLAVDTNPDIREAATEALRRTTASSK